MKWIRKAVGEMASAIRNAGELMGVVVSSGADYTLQTSKVDYKLARQLYYNTHENYKLGAGFCKPIINSTVGFMGAPKFRSEDENAQLLLDRTLNRWVGKFIKLQRNWLREGDVFVQLVRVDNLADEASKRLYKNEDVRFELRFIPPERVTVIVDPHNSDRTLKVIVRTDVEYKDEKNEKVKYKATEVWTAEQHSILYESDGPLPEGIEPIDGETNPWGFIPILWCRNENEEHELFGQSELEPVEPYIRAYHDVMMHALRTSKLTATPKLRVKVDDFDDFLRKNFSDDEIRTRTLKLSKKDVIFVDSDEEAGYIEVSGSTHEALLEFLFMCIVDVSETPEFAFGTAVASSKASVSEQMVPLAKKVLRKRSQIADDYKMLARMLMAMFENSPNGSDIGGIATYDVEIEWEDIDAQDDKAVADTVKVVVEAMVMAIEGNIISHQSAIDFLSKYVDTMTTFQGADGEESEKDKILEQRKDMMPTDQSNLDNEGQKVLDDAKKKLENNAGGSGATG
jgi:hypothetical protein